MGGEQIGEVGCLSLPGKAVTVTRPNYAKVKALNEDMEEVVLSFGNSGKLLNIINDKYINSLVEVDKVVGRVVTY